MKLTKNFSLHEFNCNCGCEMPKEVFFNVQKLASQLQVLRDYLGKPITVNSGYRCLEYNKKIGGAEFSQHTLGKASDIKVKGVPVSLVNKAIEYLINKGDMLQGGLGLYKRFNHYDIRKNKARW